MLKKSLSCFPPRSGPNSMTPRFGWKPPRRSFSPSHSALADLWRTPVITLRATTPSAMRFSSPSSTASPRCMPPLWCLRFLAIRLKGPDSNSQTYVKFKRSQLHVLCCNWGLVFCHPPDTQAQTPTYACSHRDTHTHTHTHTHAWMRGRVRAHTHKSCFCLVIFFFSHFILRPTPPLWCRWVKVPAWPSLHSAKVLLSWRRVFFGQFSSFSCFSPSDWAVCLAPWRVFWRQWPTSGRSRRWGGNGMSVRELSTFLIFESLLFLTSWAISSERKGRRTGVHVTKELLKKWMCIF